MSESRQILGHRSLSKLASLLGLRVGAGKVDPVNESCGVNGVTCHVLSPIIECYSPRICTAVRAKTG